MEPNKGRNNAIHAITEEINPAESAATEQAAVVLEDVEHYIHKFKKPFIWEDKTYEELAFDFSKLSGDDSEAIEEELRLQGVTTIIPQFNSRYLRILASRACGVASDIIAHMPIRDYTKIINKTRSFLSQTE